MIGVTTQTLRNWHKSEELVPCKVTKGGTRYYSDDQLQKYLNTTTITNKYVFIYARVSNNGQKKI